MIERSIGIACSGLIRVMQNSRFHDRSVFDIQFLMPASILFHQLDNKVFFIGNGKFW